MNEDDRGHFHRWVGFCITVWAQVDEELFNIFSQCIAPRTQCAIIYYRTPGLEVRLGLVDEIVKSLLPKPSRKSGGHLPQITKEWNAIKTDIKNHLGVRRRIAHQPVQIDTEWIQSSTLGHATLNETEFNSPGILAEIYSIQANVNERIREKESDSQPITLDHLFNHVEKVSALIPRLYKFYLSFIYELYKESSQPSLPPGPGTSGDRQADNP